MIVKRANISTDAELFNSFRGNMMAFENKPGRLYQTLEQASYETWSDGPFGRTGDEINKTISYYDKGPVVGLLFDFKIRQLTKDQKSLDDVMRFLYKEYYQKKRRGFTEEELKAAFELVAGSSLNKEYEYVTTTKELDYPTYFNYAGLNIDTTTQALPGAYAGFTLREKEDSVFIANVDYESPGWNANIRRGQQLVKINGERSSVSFFNKLINSTRPGDKIRFTFLVNKETKDMEVILGTKTEKGFKITPAGNPSPLQKQILESWLKG
jgi:predicted metalloprotease with PDZ domain